MTRVLKIKYSEHYFHSMFAIDAVNLLRNVSCPACKSAVRLANGSPYRKFDASELNADCPNRDCKLFYEALNTYFNSLDAGKINEGELNAWLDNFREV